MQVAGEGRGVQPPPPKQQPNSSQTADKQQTWAQRSTHSTVNVTTQSKHTATEHSHSTPTHPKQQTGRKEALTARSAQAHSLVAVAVAVTSHSYSTVTADMGAKKHGCMRH